MLPLYFSDLEFWIRETLLNLRENWRALCLPHLVLSWVFLVTSSGGIAHSSWSIHHPSGMIIQPSHPSSWAFSSPSFLLLLCWCLSLFSLLFQFRYSRFPCFLLWSFYILLFLFASSSFLVVVLIQLAIHGSSIWVWCLVQVLASSWNIEPWSNSIISA